MDVSVMALDVKYDNSQTDRLGPVQQAYDCNRQARARL
jgi:hypothetical protein